MSPTSKASQKLAQRAGRKALARTHQVTPRGMTGLGGGRWGSIPQPPGWYGSSAQLCGIYPFSAGTFRPGMGTPLGRDMEVGTAVAGDMKTWYDQGLISSSSMMLFGLNGNGKSSVAQRFMYGMAARGIAPAVFDPIKNEHSEAVAALGGHVVSIGPRSKHRINPLDLGALGEAADRIGGTLGDDMREAAVRQAVDLVALIVQVNRGRPLEDIEDTALGQMVRSVIARVEDPWIKDLLAGFDTPPPEVVAATGRLDAAEFQRDFRSLRDAVIAVAHGDLGYLLGAKESVRLSVGNPGGFCFDTSSIPESNTRLLSAAMLATWSIGFSTIDAHWELSQYDPSIRWGGYLTVQDEFWFPMRAVEGIVDRADRVGRTNRSLGVSELKITHSPKDFLSLTNAKDREAARGFAERSGVLGLMALSRDDLMALSQNVVRLNNREMDLVNSFNSPPGWKAQLDPDGRPLPPPGAGKMLLKIPGQVGIPIQVSLTDLERNKHVTDERSRRTPTRPAASAPEVRS
ncbi:hypothetical protein ACIA03_29130 [Nocardioides sp. NPDC051685]|uniref:hypothetical protein n=1 Tax=Nocardioides sp. NPDC051685 TaxID=3364334 RepID=UPI0037BCB759